MRVAAILALCLGLAPLAGASAQTAGERCPRTPLAPRGDGAGGARYLNPPGLMDSSRFFSQAVVAAHGTTVHVAGQTGFRVDFDRAHRLPASTLGAGARPARTERCSRST